MTGEEAIKAANEAAAWLSREPILNNATQRDYETAVAAIRALLPLARTRLLVERALAGHREIVIWNFNPGNAPAQVLIGTDMDQCGSCDIILAQTSTLVAAVEAALKGQQ